MNIKKCDRCGKCYEKNEKHRIKLGPVIANDALTGVALLDKNGIAGINYDLCDSCITDIKKFLKNE